MNILITGAWAESNKYLEEIESLGHKTFYLQNEKDELPCNPSIIEGVICNGLFLNHPIESFTNLKYIQLTSAGFDRVPMAFIKSHDIEIHNARGVYSIPMAEYAVSAVLQIYKKAASFREKQISKTWIKDRNLIELYGKNVCIVGCGSVGTECARRFNAFGCTARGIDVSPYESPEYKEMLEIDCIADVIRVSDIVILTIPLSDNTYHLINSELLSYFKDGSVLVNISRGGIVDTNALIEVLSTHRISAVLDVFENEPLVSDSPLWQMENVLISPHNSFVGNGNSTRLSNVILNNLYKYFSSN